MKVSYNNDIITLSPSLKVTASSPYEFTNTVVSFTIPSGLVYVSSNPEQGTYIASQKKWSVGTVPGNSTVNMFDFKLKVTNINNAPFTVTAVVTANELDNNSSNNEQTWIIEADTCAPAAGANPDISSCLCGSVATNDTICNKGITEWRLNTDSVENGTIESWNTLTGEYNVKQVDDSKNTTFTYNMYCVQGANEYLIAQNIPVIIRASIADKKVYDHKICRKGYEDLSAEDILVLQEQHEGVVISDFCWDVLINSNGEVTSGQPLNCNPEKDTKVTHQKLSTNYNPAQPSLGITFPTDPEKGDILIASFNDASVYYTYNGFSWIPSVSNFVVPTQIQVTGIEPNRKVVLTLSNGNTIESNIF